VPGVPFALPISAKPVCGPCNVRLATTRKRCSTPPKARRVGQPVDTIRLGAAAIRVTGIQLSGLNYLVHCDEYKYGRIQGAGARDFGSSRMYPKAPRSFLLVRSEEYKSEEYKIDVQ
jgi:hypothetical protein